MSWFSEQIEQRKQLDDEVFATAFSGIADAVLGTKLSNALSTGGEKTKLAIDAILQHYHLRTAELPEGLKDLNEQMDYCMHPHGIMRRNVMLETGWTTDAIGAMLGTRKEDGQVVAFLPSGIHGYRFLEPESGELIPITRTSEALFEKEAIAFYKPYPKKKLTLPTLIRYLFGSMELTDYVLMAAAAFGLTLLGLLDTRLRQVLAGAVLESGRSAVLLAILFFLLTVGFSRILIELVKNLLTKRVGIKLNVSVEAATMARLLSLPPSFFKNHSAGALAEMTRNMRLLSEMIVNSVLSTGLTTAFSMVYVAQIFTFAPSLVVPCLVTLLCSVALTVAASLLQMGLTKRIMELSAKESGMSYAVISGIQKIKLAGAEKRAFGRYAKLYGEELKLTYNPPFLVTYAESISLIIYGIGGIVMYHTAVKSGVSVADYFAFNVAYGMVSGAFMSLVSVALTAAKIRPVLEIVQPIMDAEPEVADGKRVITRLSGGIEINNVSFRYGKNLPYIIDNLSVKIRSGQYVAIVGSTGSGKSTLMRLLLGFEKPERGAVYYDGKDLDTIDLRSLRRKIGVVLQGGKLFMGDIYSNITISAPWLTLDQAWEAAELADIAEDIRCMPMGMHTVIAEGTGGISGGQKQRLMIARAVAPKPKILMLDEATSALDNVTQRKVSEALDRLKCTRIVIAHRLSTIRQADRILFLEGGHIVEDGTYEELMQKNGRFAELVARQQIEV